MPSCPTSKQEWDVAASKKNCEQLAAKALCNTSEKPYFYHCVINGFRNQTLEVCAPRKIIFGNLVYEIFNSCEFWCKKQLKQLRMWFFKNNFIYSLLFDFLRTLYRIQCCRRSYPTSCYGRMQQYISKMWQVLQFYRGLQMYS